LNKQKRLQL